MMGAAPYDPRPAALATIALVGSVVLRYALIVLTLSGAFALVVTGLWLLKGLTL